jgi:hypothetical protein
MRRGIHATRRGVHSTRRRSQVGLLIAALGVLGIAGAAWAFFTSTGSGIAHASVGALNAPTNVSGSPTGSTVALSWTGVTDPGSGTFGYYVTRTPYPSGSPGYACSSSPTSLLPATPTSCGDTSVASGTYTYTVTAVYNSWTATSTPSSPVTVDATIPTASAPSAAAIVTYGTSPIWVDNETVTLTDTPTDVGGTGVASVAYYYCPTSAGSCTSGTPWHSIGSSSTGPNWSVAWSSLPADGTYNVVAVATGQNANVSSPSAATLMGVDTTGPIVAAPHVAAAVTFGSSPIYVNNETVTLTDTSVTDAGSGVKSVAYYYCPTSAGSCTSGNGTQIGTASTSSPYSVTWNTPLPADGAYEIVAVVTDNVTNTSTSSSTLVTVDKTPPNVSTPSVNGFS